MEMMSLAMMTRVDKNYAPNTANVRKGLVYFHSETERHTWLRAVADYMAEQAEDQLIAELVGPKYVEEELR